MGCKSGKEGQDVQAKGAAGAAGGATLMCGSHLKSPNDLNAYPTFPNGTTSLLSKHLSKQVWESNKDKKDKYGYAFKHAIFSGCQNTDSGIGVYAGSHDSYTCFSGMFDPIILEYHGHAKTAQHVSNMDASQLKCPPFSESDAALIRSTRVRVGRNLDGYPLGPGITKEQRLEIMNKVVEACNTFEGDLKGKFYPLDSLSEAETKQLIEDHFLFKQGDRFLEACGLNRDWPSGRGIFHNDAKSFLVWVNEEDQLRIISMQNGADLGAVFERLSRAANHIEKVAKFSHDSHLGYITSCPTNLGTALRASVHIRLEYLSKDKARFQGIADKYYVQIRGIHGEHTESNEPVFDISNRRRLGRSEVDLVQDMYDGVKAMIDADNELKGN